MERKGEAKQATISVVKEQPEENNGSVCNQGGVSAPGNGARLEVEERRASHHGGGAADRR
jgi:hypothetical protein